MGSKDYMPSPAVLEQIVCLDWASPTMLECETWGIRNTVNARITFRRIDEEIWIIEGNKLRIMGDTSPTRDSVVYDLRLRLED